MRSAKIERKTKETKISVKINIDGVGKSKINTPIHFFNHMLESFSKHSLFDLELKAEGDIEVDQHHTIEDCGLLIGKVINKALEDKKGINRAGYFVFPMDEALAVVSIDISGRPYLQYEVDFKRKYCGDFDTDNLEDFFYGLCVGASSNVAVRMPYGRSDHHKLESIFKAWGKAMKMAVSTDEKLLEYIPSTKGVIDDSNY